MNSSPNTLQELVLRETEDGAKLVRFLMDVVDAEVEGVKFADRISAVRELLDRCYGKPSTAVDRSAATSDDGEDASNMLIDRILQSIDEASSDDEGEAADD